MNNKIPTVAASTWRFSYIVTNYSGGNIKQLPSVSVNQPSELNEIIIIFAVKIFPLKYDLYFEFSEQMQNVNTCSFLNISCMSN